MLRLSLPLTSDILDELGWVNKKSPKRTLLCTVPSSTLTSVLEKSHIGAKSDFEIWAFKVFFFGPEKRLQGRLVGGHN